MFPHHLYVQRLPIVINPDAAPALSRSLMMAYDVCHQSSVPTPMFVSSTSAHGTMLEALLHLTKSDIPQVQEMFISGDEDCSYLKPNDQFPQITLSLQIASMCYGAAFLSLFNDERVQLFVTTWTTAVRRYALLLDLRHEELERLFNVPLHAQVFAWLTRAKPYLGEALIRFSLRFDETRPKKECLGRPTDKARELVLMSSKVALCLKLASMLGHESVVKPAIQEYFAHSIDRVNVLLKTSSNNVARTAVAYQNGSYDLESHGCASLDFADALGHALYV